MNLIAKLIFVGLLGLSGSVFALDLQGVGNRLTANAGTNTPFAPILQTNNPFVIQSLPTVVACQNALRPTGLIAVGNVMDNQDNLAVFAGTADIVFSLHWRTNQQEWQGITPTSTIDCQTNQPLSIKATFYRQNLPNNQTTLTRALSQSFALNDGNTSFPIRLNATLNFATPPKTYSCTLVSAPQQTIHLPNVLISTLEQKGRMIGNHTANFTLNCNDTNATVLAMVYDNLDNSNFGVDKTVLSVKEGGATGVGVELYKDGQALPLGQKSLGFVPNDPTHWQIQGDEQKTLTLGAGYVKTGKVSAGKVAAQAGLVFFYP